MPRLSSHVALCGALAAAGAACVAWLGPPGTDLAAHVYQRTVFLRHGFQLWDNYWYAGRYSFAGYSWLYYPLAGWLGINVLSVLTAAVAAGAFASIVAQEWPTAGVWPARVFALAAAASVLTGAYPYALGLALALLALRALRPLRVWRFAACAALSFAASPLAFLILLVILIAIAAAGRRRVIGPGTTVAAILVVAGVLWRVFPGGGSFPFSGAELAATLVFCTFGAAFTVRVAAARVMHRFFLVYAAASVAAFVVPSSIGENIARLRFVALPVAVLALALRRWRPVVPAFVALLLAASWNLTPLAFGLARGTADPSSHAAYWTPVVRFLGPRLPPSYRVEAVDTSGHWEAVYLPEHGIPIVRGWFRQDDFPENALLYGDLRGPGYLSWLRSMGVAYVVLTDAPADYSARDEARLLRADRSGLQRVFSSRHAVVYAVPHPVGIVSGAVGAHLTRLAPSKLTMALPRAGVYRVAVHYSPYWHPTAGCVTRRGDGMIELTVRHAGTVELTFAVTPHRIVDAGLGVRSSC